ncbi:hypothetical protein [Dietzia sp. 111N12-1]|uniref:hypothetical protein n=1 Tax=Dietzia sp. 111N12-1 TaxID=1785156 RepID=UPI0008049C70|nr:hypothetical protein [Dietzia sp. 111N12-1]OAV78248.1 hypothetical protein AYO52_12965 [Dietzia sp. 111N12-1]
MSAQAFGNDQMRTYLADALAAADSPLTVMPHDPEDPWGVLFRDTRFHYSFMSVRQDRLMGLLDTRTPEAVARGLEYRSAVSEIAVDLNNYGEPDQMGFDQWKALDDAMYSGVFSVYLHSSEIKIDVPIEHIRLDDPDLLGERALGVIAKRLNRVTGTTRDDRYALMQPVGDAIKSGTLAPPASWSPTNAPAPDSGSSAIASQFTESYLSHRTDARNDDPGPGFASPPNLANQSFRVGPEM